MTILPPELLHHILECLPVNQISSARTLARFARCASYCRDMAYDERLWHDLIHSRWSNGTFKAQCLRNLYIRRHNYDLIIIGFIERYSSAENRFEGISEMPPLEECNDILHICTGIPMPNPLVRSLESHLMLQYGWDEAHPRVWLERAGAFFDPVPNYDDDWLTKRWASKEVLDHLKRRDAVRRVVQLWAFPGEDALSGLWEVATFFAMFRGGDRSEVSLSFNIRWNEKLNP